MKNIILMGVSGCGKTLIGKLLAEKLDVTFFDGDDFHPEVNVEKMRSGEPLNDRDRLPWLETVAGQIEEMDRGGGGVLACSALKQTYREILQRADAPVTFVYLKGERDLIARRLAEREGHYMPAELLDSQFRALEEPANALTVSINQTPQEIVSEILHKLGDKK
ncbi:MAG: AAA family ATPase [Bacteroidetes bacterium]|jgi:carbohydrate kinase (thermoresistant glucokinase family)|nr:AAA family ATPase [Bacteroidota bacterium]